MNYLKWFSGIRANFVFFKNWRQHNILMNKSGERLYIKINLRRAKWLTIHSYHLHRRRFTSRLQSFNTNLDLYFPKWKNSLRRFHHNYGGAYIKYFPWVFLLQKRCKRTNVFKSSSNTSCIDLTLTNKECFKISCCNEPRRSDFHKMTVFVIQSVIW